MTTKIQIGGRVELDNSMKMCIDSYHRLQCLKRGVDDATHEEKIRVFHWEKAIYVNSFNQMCEFITHSSQNSACAFKKLLGHLGRFYTVLSALARFCKPKEPEINIVAMAQSEIAHGPKLISSTFCHILQL